MKKKIHLNPLRTYRDFYAQDKKEPGYQVVVEESDLWITSQVDLKDKILDELHRLRAQIKAYIELHPEFLTSLKPVSVPESAPSIIREMALAGKLFDVGPMAAVAGSIAQHIAQKFHHLSPNLLIENGGDVYMYSETDRQIGILAHPEENLHLGLKIYKEEFPCALCASSATIGHSLSFGRGDLVVVKANNGAIADAAATALNNKLQNKSSLARVLKTARQWKRKGVTGVFAQFEDEIGVWGAMELIGY